MPHHVHVLHPHAPSPPYIPTAAAHLVTSTHPQRCAEALTGVHRGKRRQAQKRVPSSAQTRAQAGIEARAEALRGKKRPRQRFHCEGWALGFPAAPKRPLATSPLYVSGRRKLPSPRNSSRPNLAI